ncbi:MAG: hypothetical protein KatS3mg058_1936 [Roseiflexus sp.]|nr:MAG: hypothetical protein KatS3mg058_1936 [Roseiflexus sp.]
MRHVVGELRKHHSKRLSAIPFSPLYVADPPSSICAATRMELPGVGAKYLVARRGCDALLAVSRYREMNLALRFGCDALLAVSRYREMNLALCFAAVPRDESRATFRL